MNGDPGSTNDRVRGELIGCRGSHPPLEIRLHHILDDDCTDFQVWARMVRLDGTEAFAVISRDDADVCKAVWGKAVIWMTRLKRRARSINSWGPVEEEMKEDRTQKPN